MITSMIKTTIIDDLELAFVSGTVESTGKVDNNGFFITHNIFKK